MKRTFRSALALAAVVAMMGCGSDDGQGDAGGDESDGTPTGAAVIDPGDGGDYDPDVDPDDFVEVIDNPYLPLTPGSTWTYEGVEDDTTERIEVEVTDERREVMGISAVVVRDTVYEDGEIVEDTEDWFAQDSEGNVWYLGEDSREFEDGEQVSTEGSWEAAVDGALPGIVMPADPQVGDAYRQEFYEGEAEDLAQVVQVGFAGAVPAGEFTDVLVIREWNPLEPDVVEDKYHAPGVGVILEKVVEGGDERVELIEFTPGV